MSRLLRVVLTVAVAWTCVGAAQSPREAELKAIIATQPAELAPYLELAKIYQSLGRLDDGERVLRDAMKVHRDSGAVFAALAGLYSSTDDEKLLAITREWAGVEPANVRPYMIAAQVHLNRVGRMRDRPADAMEQMMLARELVDSAIAQQPDDAQPRGLRIRVLMMIAAATTDPAVRAEAEREIQAARQIEAKLAGSGRPPGMPGGPAAEPLGYYPNAVRVGGNVRAPLKIRDVKPVMPDLAVKARVQGVVILEAVIDEVGAVAQARVLRSIPLLDLAAMEAVKQWMFTPTLIDGKAVPVIMTVTVQFTADPQ
jgi:protein TonB